jgi:catechol 2,3-dioxygenase
MTTPTGDNDMLASAQTTKADTEFVTFGPVHLDIVDKNRSVKWWRDVVGLELIADHGRTAELGVDGEALVVLAATASSPVRRGYSGLYHLAINLPDEVAFAQTLARLMSIRARPGTTDHVVAKSIYLGDPDGIGLELTVELPERVKSISWPPTEQHPEIIDAEGRSRQGLEELDVDAVLAKLPGGELPRSLPSGTHVGHVHLKVPDVDASFAFYRDRLGMIPNNYVPAIGYADLGTGDFRLHRVAVNTWTGVGLPPRPPEMAGMDHYTLRVDSMHRLHEMLGRLADAQQVEFGFITRDPAGNAFTLTA